MGSVILGILYCPLSEVKYLLGEMAGLLLLIVFCCAAAGSDVVRAGGDTAIVGGTMFVPLAEGLLLMACFLLLAIALRLYIGADDGKSRAETRKGGSDQGVAVDSGFCRVKLA